VYQIGVQIPTREGAIVMEGGGVASLDMTGGVRRSIHSKQPSKGQHRYGLMPTAWGSHWRNLANTI